MRNAREGMLTVQWMPMVAVLAYGLGLVAHAEWPVTWSGIACGLLLLVDGFRFISGDTLAVTRSMAVGMAGMGAIVLGSILASIITHRPIGSHYRLVEWMVPFLVAVVTASSCRGRPGVWIDQGAVCGWMLAVGTVVTGALGMLYFRTIYLFGFPNVNVAVNCCGPFIVAGIIAAWQGRRSGDRSSPEKYWEVGLRLGGLAVGLVALGAASVLTGRRGIVMAVLLGISGLLIVYAWRRSRFISVLLLLVVGTTCAVYAGKAMDMASLLGSGQRIWLFKSGYEAIVASMPLGAGFHPALWALDAGLESSRWLSAADAFGLHFHSEAIEVIATAGVLGLIGAILFLVSLVLSLRVADCASFAPCLVFGITATAVALIDPSYSNVVGGMIIGTGIGFLWREGPVVSVQGNRIFAVMVLGFAAILLLGLLPAAMIRERMRPEVRMILARWVLDPELVLLAAAGPAEAGQPWLPSKNDLDAMMRWIGNVGVLPGIRSELAWRSGDRDQIVAAECAVLRKDPLFHRSLFRLAQVTSGQSGMAIPEDDRRRMRWVTGQDDAPLPEIGSDSSLTTCADAVAQLVARSERGSSTAEDGVVAARLLDRVSEWSAAVDMLFMAGMDDPHHLSWMKSRATWFRQHLKGTWIVARLAERHAFKHPRHAWEIYSMVWPDFAAAARSQTVIAGDLQTAMRGWWNASGGALE